MKAKFHGWQVSIELDASRNGIHETVRGNERSFAEIIQGCPPSLNNETLGKLCS